MSVDDRCRKRLSWGWWVRWANDDESGFDEGARLPTINAIGLRRIYRTE
ncbi:hypothetical protein [Burkholderia sp. IMCC1007]|nr:hypothetical protein [Burkholderia sp. IMCC1007]